MGMVVIAIRLILGVTLFFGGAALVDWIFDTDALGAIGRALLWFWRGSIEFLARFAGLFSQSFAASVRALAQRTILRRIAKPVWRFVTVIILIALLNQVRQEQIEGWLSAKQLQALTACKRVLAFKPEWPRGVRASIALVVISVFVWAFFWISDHVGVWWGLGASVILWEMASNAQVIGLDSLTSFVIEKWE